MTNSDTRSPSSPFAPPPVGSTTVSPDLAVNSGSNTSYSYTPQPLPPAATLWLSPEQTTVDSKNNPSLQVGRQPLTLSPHSQSRLSVLPLDVYHIVNVFTGAYAALQNSNADSDVVTVTPGLDGDGERGSTWAITHLKRDEYKLENLEFGTHASHNHEPKVTETVLGKRTPISWTIRPIENTNAYSIAPSQNTDLFWMCTHGQTGTPIEFGQPSTSRRCQWWIRALGSPEELPPYTTPVAPPAPPMQPSNWLNNEIKNTFQGYRLVKGRTKQCIVISIVIVIAFLGVFVGLPVGLSIKFSDVAKDAANNAHLPQQTTSISHS